MAAPCWNSTRALRYLLLAALLAWAGKAQAGAMPTGDLPACPASLAGAVSVTDENGNPVGQNLFATRTGAYLISGAPCGSGGQSSNLPAGTYTFQVTAIDGTLLSTDPAASREFTVDAQGRIISTNEGHPWNNAACAGAGLAIQLSPYNSSPNGDYLVWVTPKACYDCNAGNNTNGFFFERSKISAFKVSQQNAIPDIKIEKRVNGQKLAEALPGEVVTFTLSISNVGTVDAPNVRVEDLLPAGLVYVNASSSSSDALLVGMAPRLQWRIPELKVGASVQISFQAKLDAVSLQGSCGFDLVNEATANAMNIPVAARTEGCPSAVGSMECVYVGDIATVRVKCLPPPQLVLSKNSVVEDLPLKSGSWIRYTLTLKNVGGSEAFDVSVVDAIPPLTQNIHIVSATGDKGDNGTWYWTAERLTVVFKQVKIGETCTVVFKVQVRNSAACDSVITNAAKAVTGSLEVASNTTADKIECVAPKLALSKKSEVLDPPLRADSWIQYTLLLKNEGDAPAANVTVTDTISALTQGFAGVAVVGDKGSAGYWSWAAGVINVSFKEVKAGETCTITFKVQVKAQAACDSQIVNKAQVQFAGQSAWSNEVAFKMDCPPDLCSSTKTVADLNGGKLRPGDLLEYRITLVNSGTTEATAVRVTDELSALLESTISLLQIPAGAEDHSAGSSLDIRNIRVPAKCSAEVVFQVRVRANAKCGSRIGNTAVIHPGLEGGQVCSIRSRDLVLSYCGNYEVIGGIDLGGDPVMGAVNSVTHQAVVTSGLLNRVVVVDLLGQKVIAYVPVESPYGVAVNPETNEAVVTNLWSDSVTIVDLNQMKVAATIPVGSIPKGVAVNPRTNRAVVVNSGSGSVSIIDLAARIVTANIKVGYGPDSVAINPLTNKAAVSNNRSGSVSILDLATGKLEANLPVGAFPLGVAFNTATNLVYAANQGDGSLSNIDPVAKKLLGHIVVGDRSSMPEQVDVDENSDRAAVSLFNEHALAFVDLTSGEILARVDLRPYGGRGPRGVAMDRELGIVLVVHQQSNIVLLVSM